MDRKSVWILLLTVLIVFGACTPLSLLYKGKKVVKEAESFVQNNDLSSIANKAAAKAKELQEQDEVPADSTAAEVPADAVEAATDSIATDTTAIATSTDSVVTTGADDLADAAPAAAKMKRDTTTMDSLELAIYKYNKLIDDSLALDSLNRKRKNGIDAPVKYSANDSLTYEAGTGRAFLYGESHVEYQNMDLKSDRIFMVLDSFFISKILLI